MITTPFSSFPSLITDISSKMVHAAIFRFQNLLKSVHSLRMTCFNIICSPKIAFRKFYFSNNQRGDLTSAEKKNRLTREQCTPLRLRACPKCYVTWWSLAVQRWLNQHVLKRIRKIDFFSEFDLKNQMFEPITTQRVQVACNSGKPFGRKNLNIFKSAFELQIQ